MSLHIMIRILNGNALNMKDNRGLKSQVRGQGENSKNCSTCLACGRSRLILGPTWSPLHCQSSPQATYHKRPLSTAGNCPKTDKIWMTLQMKWQIQNSDLRGHIAPVSKGKRKKEVFRRGLRKKIGLLQDFPKCCIKRRLKAPRV